MLFPNDILQSTPVLSGLSFHQRSRPFISPYLQCTFSTVQHQFICDTMVTTTALAKLAHADMERKSHIKPTFPATPKDNRTQSDQHTLQPHSHFNQTPPVYSNFCFQKWNPVFCLITLLTILPVKITKHSSVTSSVLWQSGRQTIGRLLCTMANPYLVLTYLTFVAYWPSLWAELVFDDRPAIIENKDLRSDAPWSRVWFNDFWGTPIKSVYSHKSYRPLTVLTFRLNYLVHELDPFGYHLTNVLLHLAVTVLFYRFCLYFFNHWRSASASTFSESISSKVDSSSPNVMTSIIRPTPTSSLFTVPFYLSVLFAVHPIHTDCVSSVVGRAELLSAILYLLSILTWNIKSSARQNDVVNAKKYKNYFQQFSDKKHKLLAIVLAIVGFVCKEQSIFVLVYLAFGELTNSYNSPSGAHLNTRHSACDSSSAKTRRICRIAPIRRRSYWRTRLAWIVLLAISFLLVIYVRLGLMDYTLPTFNRFDNPAHHAPYPTKQFTYAYLALYHFWLLVSPTKLACDWTHISIELVDLSSGHFYQDLARLFAVVCTFGAVLYGSTRLTTTTFWGRRRHRVSMAAACQIHDVPKKSDEMAYKSLHALVLTIVPFVPASNIFFPTGFVIAERVLYLPSMGLLLLLGIGLQQILSANTQKRFSRRFCTRIAMLVLCAAFIGKTFLRSYDWTNEHRLYKSGLEVNPNNVKLINNLGRLYEKDNQIQRAIEMYNQAIGITPKDIRSYLNLGNALLKINDKTNAERTYREAMKQAELDMMNFVSGKVNGVNEAFLAKDATLRSQISPLYFTALVRLADLIKTNSSRESDLKQIHRKMAAFQTLLTGSFNDNLSPKGERGTLAQHMAHNSKRKLSVATSCGANSDNNFIYSMHREDPYRIDQLYNLAVVFYQQGNPKEALHCFEQVLQLQPHHEGSLLASARIIQDEDLDQLNEVAFERLNMLVKLGKADESVYFSLAMLAVKANRFGQAKQLFEQAISKRNSFAEAHYNMALLLVKELRYLEQHSKQFRDNLQQAVFHLKQVLVINPKHVKSMLVLGDLHAEELNRVDLSEYYYQMVIDQADPENIQARNNLCVLLYKRGQLHKAINCFEKLKSDIFQFQTDNVKETIDLIQEQINVLTKANKTYSSKSGRNKPLNDSNNQVNSLTGARKGLAANGSQDHWNGNDYRYFLGPKYVSAMCFI